MKRNFVFSALFFCGIAHVVAQHKDSLLNILSDEMKREMSGFKSANKPPYFIAYRINDSHATTIRSSFGSLTSITDGRTRTLQTDIKVGSYEFDDSHPEDDLEGLNRSFGNFSGETFGQIPIENKIEPIKLELWQQTQRAYRSALNRYNDKKNATRLSETKVDDFAKQEPVISEDEALPSFSNFFDGKKWTDRIKEYTKPFQSVQEMVEAEAFVRVGLERTYLVTSEGTQIAQNRTFAYLYINASVRSEDGDNIPLHLSYFSFSPAGLPSDEKVLADVKDMQLKLVKLKAAPKAEPYTGPAILYSHAAGVFFHEIFGHRVEGHRLKNKNDGQTFKNKVGELVLTKTISVISDPTLKNFGNQDLNGYYKFDDEGVQGEKVEIVQNGVLKNFLMSRTPIENFNHSNGHGRAQTRMEVASRQSNLIVKDEKPVSMDDLRKMLIHECKNQKKEYGYFFKDVVGGFTFTQRSIPNAFNIFPTEVYRIYVDGRPDELVRGVDLIGTPLAMFSEILAADNQTDVFTGFCGAESGYVPVTAISPSLFVRKIETQKKQASQLEKNLISIPAN